MSQIRIDELPGPLTLTLSPSPCPSPTPSFPTRHVRLALSLVPLLLIGAWAAVDWRAMHDGTARLASADPWWLLAGVVFTCLCWASAAVTRQGAIPERLPPGPLLASQFAAGAANHVLPAGIGAHAVTLRFLQGRGISLARATASLALYSLVKPIAKLVLILAFLLAFPGTLLIGQLVPDGQTLLLGAVGVLVGLAATAVLLTVVRRLRRPLLEFVRTALTDARILHTRPSRVLALWGGAVAFPLFQAGVLASVGASLGLPLPWAHVVFAYLAASAVAGAVPAPGGIGPVDAALVIALVVFGAPMTLATASVIGYRVLTVWLPLLPGAIVLSALVRRKVL
ncbi:flippase-like domain-containing protein [Streptomyces sp. NBC_00243]|uniref:lysylphosphatidylglycerol synthase transmembrane domain-containing protein n=1 Tax=Streptomyces sp. NBC_00243 TaxID=2975688 RepID=UPI002DDB4869|nr:lysylphosphatidylglycerol synthase transmembrane domain-containing protein [Streptomyces sp. NBC_00243]WRZ19129.1 flippase-like domain-containing protein [Streptomyces sp. NBC_00243]